MEELGKPVAKYAGPSATPAKSVEFSPTVLGPSRTLSKKAVRAGNEKASPVVERKRGLFPSLL
jgi:hypothetical protein